MFDFTKRRKNKFVEEDKVEKGLIELREKYKEHYKMEDEIVRKFQSQIKILEEIIEGYKEVIEQYIKQIKMREGIAKKDEERIKVLTENCVSLKESRDDFENRWKVERER